MASLFDHQLNVSRLVHGAMCLPISLPGVCDELKVPFPEIAGDLCPVSNDCPLTISLER